MKEAGTTEAKAASQRRKSTILEMDKHIADPPPYSPPPLEQQLSSGIDTNGHATSPPPNIQSLDFTPSSLELPTAAECIAHLRLLHAFAKLRHDVGNEEGLFGISLDKHFDTGELMQEEDAVRLRNDSHQPEGVHAQATPATPATLATVVQCMSDEEKAEATLQERLREKRWTIFVTKAVDRFDKWWQSLPTESNLYMGAVPHLRTTDFSSLSGCTRPLDFLYKVRGYSAGSGFELPPLDVLMVWHSYMLNPRVYLEDCLRLSKPQLWHTSLPWESIFKSIDADTHQYTHMSGSGKMFVQTPGTSYNKFDDGILKAVSCPKCQKVVEVPWTRPPEATTRETLEAYLVQDTGYAGEAFTETCSKCQLVITHEKLRVGKFIDDVDSLRVDQRPLPGTILNSKGMPQMTEKNKEIGTHDPFFPHRIINAFADHQPPAMRKDVDVLSMDTIRKEFSTIMGTRAMIVKVNSQQFKPELLAKESKIAVRKMFSHYWDNSSRFGLDLVGAVIRQGSFVQKMHKIDWLHSPAAITTMQRLIVKYHRFIRLIAENPKKTAVPTLDVDLAWHTHQLSPDVYQRYTVAETKKFVNHDDKISETSLHTSFQWTSVQYEKKYGQPYSECACWYCECTREPLRSSFTNRVNPFRSSKQYDVEVLTERHLPRDPFLGVHVSAHNAVTMGPYEGQSTYAQQRRKELEDLDLQYAKVCKRYQKKKKGEQTPSRNDDAYVYGAYGYPMYYPVYVPYYPESTDDNNRYSSAGGGGGCGSCAAGTCAGSTSLGGCAGGEGTPGCKASCGGHGDAAGGCGTCSSGGGDGGGCGGCGGG